MVREHAGQTEGYQDASGKQMMVEAKRNTKKKSNTSSYDSAF
jgi:hypothetical protein